jgi:hypothetical protein
MKRTLQRISIVHFGKRCPQETKRKKKRKKTSCMENSQPHNAITYTLDYC